MAEKPKATGSQWESEHGWLITLGTWVWIFGLISGIVYLIWGIVNLSALSRVPSVVIPFITTTVPTAWYASRGIGIWYIIGGAFNIIFSIAVVKFRFSDKVKNRDWNFLYEQEILKLGSLRFPLMLLYGILLSVFGFGWGGILMLIVVFFLLFAGPQEYQWKSA